ncbi:hypothetical protein pb186bvf_021179 [Paramecium bursaria]
MKQINHFQQFILPKINLSQYNIFFIGKSGGGKSTCVNGISGKKVMFQLDEGSCFIPDKLLSEIYFPIADDSFESKTKEAQEIQLSEDYQVWDLPGYQDSRTAQEDLRNIIIKKLIIDNSNKSQIVILLPEAQLTGDKGGFLIDIINLLSDDGIIPTIFVSFANEDLDLEFVCCEFKKFITNEETILTKKGKELLQNVIDQNRVQLFKQPVLVNDDIYELCQDNLKELRNLILQPKFFQKVSLKFQLLDDAKQLLKQLCGNLSNELSSFENQILSGLLEIWEQRITDYRQVNTQKIKQLKFVNQKLQNSYSNQLKNIKILGQFIKEFNDLDDKVEGLKHQLESIVVQEQMVQQIDILKIFCAQMTIKRLKEILKNYNNISTVFVCSLFSFQIDDNFDCQGLSIFIKTKNFVVASQQNLYINLKGKDGMMHVQKKADQNLNDKNGQNGMHGHNGQNGGNFFLTSEKYVNMNKLVINLSGGNGSDGQDGGDGKDGENGRDAQQKQVNMKEQNCEQFCEESDYTDELDIFTFNKENQIHYISKGTSGTQGGNAGRGGLGGLGGRKGTFKIASNQEACEIIYKDGISGQNGIDGKIGHGGINGKDYERKCYDIKLFEGIDKLTHQSEEMKKLREKLGMWTFGTVQIVGSIFQKLIRDGKWIENGQYNDNGHAQNGFLNQLFQDQQENLKQSYFEEYLEEFQIFIENVKIENSGPIYDHLLSN